MTCPIITLTTDFGLKDLYVAEMKAVILGISRNATIVDITHQVEKFNIRMGAYVLASAVPYFPKGTIHVAVVDPHVGTNREPILVNSASSYFVGPNNGVLALAAGTMAGSKHVRRITARKFMLSSVSNTFHGRDIFASVAAHLANGAALEDFGPEISDIVSPEFSKVCHKEGMLVGEVLHVDDFGNVITNIKKEELVSMRIKDLIGVKLIDTRRDLKFCGTYAEVERGEPLALIGSHNFLEISVNQGSAAEVFGIKGGDRITVYRSQ